MEDVHIVIRFLIFLWWCLSYGHHSTVVGDVAQAQDIKNIAFLKMTRLVFFANYEKILERHREAGGSLVFHLELLHHLPRPHPVLPTV